MRGRRKGNGRGRWRGGMRGVSRVGLERGDALIFGARYKNIGVVEESGM